MWNRQLLQRAGFVDPSLELSTKRLVSQAPLVGPGMEVLLIRSLPGECGFFFHELGSYTLSLPLKPPCRCWVNLCTALCSLNPSGHCPRPFPSHR